MEHQPSDAMLPHPLPTSHKHLPDVRTPVGLATVLMEHSDCCEQRAIGGRPPTLWTSSPRVIPCWEYGQRSAYQSNGIATVVLLDRTVSHWDSLAKNAAARFKQSRSWVDPRQFPLHPDQLLRLGALSSACGALSFGLSILTAPPIPKILWNPHISGNLGHRTSRLLH